MRAPESWGGMAPENSTTDLSLCNCPIHLILLSTLNLRARLYTPFTPQYQPMTLYITGGKHKALHLVLSGLAPCFYPAAAPSSPLTVKE